MNSLRDLYKQLKTQWAEWTLLRKASLVGGVIACLVVTGLVGKWASRPQYVAVASGLDPTGMKAALDRLDAKQIKYKLSLTGSTVMVPKPQVPAAMLAIGDVAAVSPTGMMDQFPLPGTENSIERMQLEQHLSDSVATMAGVSSAKVKIASPAPSPFLRPRATIKASVMLETTPISVSWDVVEGIRVLVASSVPGLTPENVSVVDAKGGSLSSEASSLGWQAAVSSDMETRLSRKAESLLNNMLGAGRSMVQVTAELDFSSETRDNEIYDPEQRAMTSKTTEDDENKGIVTKGAAQAGTITRGVGTAGTSSNDAGDNTSNLPLSGGSKKKMVTENYNVSRESRTVVRPPGKVTRLSVAAVVDLSEFDEAERAAMLTRVESLVKDTVGIDTVNREDSLTVVDQKLTVTAPVTAAPIATVQQWRFYEQLARNVSLGAGAVVALVLGLMIVRRIRPMSLDAAGPEGLSAENARRVASLGQEARDDPEMFQQILRAWLNEPLPEAPPRPQVERPATVRAAA